MNRLNPRQQEAVHAISGPVLVLAGAGSGKTSVITRKIAYLVQQCGMSARHIVAVTFTNKAAREMKERVGSLLRGREAHGLTVSTFHNLGLNIIRREHALLGYKSGFSIFDDSDVKNLLTEIMQKEYAGDDGVDEIKNLIGQWKNDLVLPEQALEQARTPKCWTSGATGCVTCWSMNTRTPMPASICWSSCWCRSVPSSPWWAMMINRSTPGVVPVRKT